MSVVIDTMSPHHRGFAGKVEQALTDDVALDLARPAHDRVGTRGQQLVYPPSPVDRVLVAGHEERVGAEHRYGRVLQPLAHCRPEQLHDARLCPDLLAPGEPTE